MLTLRLATHLLSAREVDERLMGRCWFILIRPGKLPPQPMSV